MFDFGSRGQKIDNFLEQLRNAATVSGADGDGVTKTEPRKIGVEVLMFRVVDLVDHEHDGNARSSQHAGKIFIDRCAPLLRIDNEKNHVALAHGGRGCVAHLCNQS